MALSSPERSEAYPDQKTLVNLRVQIPYEIANKKLPETGKILAFALTWRPKSPRYDHTI